MICNMYCICIAYPTQVLKLRKHFPKRTTKFVIGDTTVWTRVSLIHPCSGQDLEDIRRELGPLWCETNLANTELSLHKAFRGRAGKVRSCQLGECRVLMFVDLPPLEHVNMLVQKQSPALRLGVTVISEPQGGFPSVTL